MWAAAYRQRRYVYKMKIEKRIIATSHRDSHGEILHSDGLKDMVENIKEKYVRVGVEHDPRIPPLGRIVDANIFKMEDGEYAVEAVMEIFEKDDLFIPIDNKKKMISHQNELNHLLIRYDRSFREEDNLRIVNEIAGIFNSKPVEEVKKALDPLSILIISGGFILTSIAAGFFGKFGSDLFDSFKNKLKQLYKRKSSQEQLLIFEFTIYSQGNITVSIILTNPDDLVIDSFFSDGLNKLEKLLPHYFDHEFAISEIFLKYNNGKLEVTYGIRKDGIPIFPKK